MVVIWYDYLVAKALKCLAVTLCCFRKEGSDCQLLSLVEAQL